VRSLGALSAQSEAGASWPEDAVEVGRIVDAWGIKGGIKVLPFAKDPQALFSTTRWFLKAPETGRTRLGPAAIANHPIILKVIDTKPHGEVILAQVRDVLDRNAAEALIGYSVFVPRSSFPTPGADEYYWMDLIGMTVVNRQSESLGVVAGLIDTGPHSVLQVQSPDGGERLIPFVSAYVDDVSISLRSITVDWGLDY
jgi:16S rRNA processing protein RimM